MDRAARDSRDASGRETSPRQPPRTASVVAWVLPHLLAYVGALGHDVERLRRLPGLRGRNLDDPDQRVPDSAASEAWQLAAEITGDEALGLHMAQTISAGAVDLLEFAFRSSATLELAFAQLARYGRVMSDRAAATVGWDADALSVTWDGRLVRQRVDFALAFIVRLARESTGAEVVPSAVHFAYQAPGELREYREFFGGARMHGGPANRLLFDRSAAARPFATADPALALVLRRRLDKLLAQ